MEQITRLLGLLLMAAGTVSVLAGITAAFRLTNHFRADVPRHVREQHDGHGLSAFVLLGDYYTTTGKRLQARMMGTMPFHILFPIGLAGFLYGNRGGLGPFAMVTLVWTALATGWFALAQWVFVVRRERHARETPPLPPAPDEYGPGHLRLCACCGFPTVLPDDETMACDLCDWSVDDEELPPLEEARRHFARDLTAYDPARYPAWRPDGLTAEERRERRQQVKLFERYRRAPGGYDDPRLWAQADALGLPVGDDET